MPFPDTLAFGLCWSADWLGETLACGTADRFMGLGEPGPHVNRRGRDASMWVVHTFEADDIPVPFYISSAGYGLFLCNSFEGRFDMASNRQDRVQFRARGGEVDFFVILGQGGEGRRRTWFGDVVSEYTHLTGRSPLPPRWAFGYMQSRAAMGTKERAMEVVTRLREDGFPLDSLHMDGWNHRANRLWFTDYRFPDPLALLNRLRERHVKLSVWETPHIWKTWEGFDEAEAAGFFAKTADGARYPVEAWVGKDLGLVDFTNPDACAWWQAQHAEAIEAGVKCFMTDGGDGKSVPRDAVFHAGRGDEVHNLYPLYFNRCVYEGQQKARPGERVFVWTRTGYAGIQRYPVQWGGDELSTFEGTRVLIRAGINAGVCGIPFRSQDAAGFHKGRTEELYVRSCQWGFLAPLTRVHGISENADPDIIGNEPWVFGDRAERIVRKYARLRYRLLPYARVDITFSITLNQPWLAKLRQGSSTVGSSPPRTCKRGRWPRSDLPPESLYHVIPSAQTGTPGPLRAPGPVRPKVGKVLCGTPEPVG